MAACQPQKQGETWRPLAKTASGRSVQRNTCVIKYRINEHRNTKQGRDMVAMGMTSLIHQRTAAMGKLTGVKWVYEGSAVPNFEGFNGRDYAENTGVLIEYQNNTWSQPLPAKGPFYKGGIMWLNASEFGITPSRPNRQGLINYIDHELAHQYGLADTYHNRDGGKIDMTVKMGRSSNPWRAGDLAGLRDMTVDSRATCKRRGM